MTEAQEQFRAFKSTLGSFVNARPRDFDTPELTNGAIDRVVKALDEIRPQRVGVEVETVVEPQTTLDLKTEGDAPDQRKAKQGRDRKHKGGQDRNQG